MALKTRVSARWIVVDQRGRVLLLRFSHAEGALAGKDYWATPGGGVEPGETVEEAAVRELTEETGLRVSRSGPEIARRSFVMTLPDGEQVQADERYFLTRVTALDFSASGLDPQERRVISGHRWWSLDELTSTDETVWPEGLADLLRPSEDAQDGATRGSGSP